MLEGNGVDKEYVLEHQVIDGIPWYNFYTMTVQEWKEWREWCLKYLRTTYLPKSRVEREFEYFNLIWGLKLSDDPHTKLYLDG